MMRILGLARQSSSDRGTGTIETQVETLTDACDERDDFDLVDIVIDKVSGKYSPFDASKRKTAGWLTDPAKIASFDGFMITARDRIDRDGRYRLDFLDWVKEHGKKVFTADYNEIRTDTADEWNAEASAAVSAEAYRRQLRQL